MIRIVVLMFIVGLVSCSTEPQPLSYGQDACYTCKMTLVDKKFGAEVVTGKGKVFKFDDVNCMIGFLNSGYVADKDMAHQLVIDFANPEKLIDARFAFFIKSDQIKSPMASQVAAFERKDDADEFKNKLNGIYLVWGELAAQFK